jgi:hypothetical protein
MFRGKTRLIIISIAISLLFAGISSAQSSSAQSSSGKSSSEKNFDRIRLGTSLGFAASPSFGLLELGFEGGFYLNENLSIGPWLALGLAEDTVSLLFSVNTRYEGTPFSGKMKKLRAFGQGGLGLAYSSFNSGGNKANDFLINYGVGVDYPVGDTIWVGSNIMFNSIPTTPPGGAFMFTWQFFNVSARF